MGGNMKKMMKQVQKMQADMERVQKELGKKIEATAGEAWSRRLSADTGRCLRSASIQRSRS